MQVWIWNAIVRLVMLAIYLLTEGSWATGVQTDLKEMNWSLAFVPNICDSELCCVATARWHQHIEWPAAGWTEGFLSTLIDPAITDMNVLMQIIFRDSVSTLSKCHLIVQCNFSDFKLAFILIPFLEGSAFMSDRNDGFLSGFWAVAQVIWCKSNAQCQISCVLYSWSNPL